MAANRSMRQPSKRAPRRSSFSFLVTVLLTTSMVATGGFGAFPDNPVTDAVQEEIGRNFPPAVLDPINFYLDELSVPTIAPQPASEPNPPLDLDGLFLNEPTKETSVPAFDTPSPTFTLTNTPDLTTTATLTATATSTSTSSPTSTATVTITPTRVCSRPSTTPATTTFFNGSSLTVEVYLVDPACDLALIGVLGPGQAFVQETFIGQLWWFVDSASTRLLANYVVSSANETVDVSTGLVTIATPTPLATATSVPFSGFTVSNVVLTDDLYQSGTSITLSPGQEFYVSYNFRVFNDPCPGCITQLVTGLNAPGSYGEWCAYDGIPGIAPGVSGSEGTTLFAPEGSGTYPVIVVYFWHFSCADALANYPSGLGAQFSRVIGQIVVP